MFLLISLLNEMMMLHDDVHDTSWKQEVDLNKAVLFDCVIIIQNSSDFF